MTAELRLWNRADFNPRSPHGERHSGKRNKVCHKSFQSTLPARGATGEQYATTSYVDISIHAPRTGSDIIGAGTIVRPLTISIHAPRTGSDVEISDLSRGGDISIHAPRTGSDHAMFLPHTGRHYFNPRSPHGERPYLLHPMERFGNYFNPRSPHGERRGTVRYHLLCRYFNPRSPHGERHNWSWNNRSAINDFNPRSPHGERRGNKRFK